MPKEPQESIKLLATLLTHYICLIKQMVALLSEEKKVLTERNADSILAIQSKKENLLEEITILDTERSHLFLQQHLPDNPEGMTTFIALAEKNIQSELTLKWKELKSLLKQCAQMNEVNGMITNLTQHSTKQVLSILTGKECEHPHHSGLYDGKGQKETE